jgi:hypothetical protein
MIALLVILLLLALAGWLIVLLVPTWTLSGPPAIVKPLFNLVKRPSDFMGVTTLHRLREYSLIAAAVITVLLILVFWWYWRRSHPMENDSKSKTKSKKKSNN